MAKGFSFVLVSVVMVMMTVFGLLSLTSAGADLRLAQKAAAAQQIYYETDTRAERIYAACRNAADAAGKTAAAADVSAPLSLTAGTGSLRALARQTAGGAAWTPEQRRRLLYFCALETGLRGIGGVSVSADPAAFEAARAGSGAGSAVLTARFTVRSAKAASHSLSVVLACPYGGASAPSFTVKKWTSSVGGLTDGGSSHVNVWSGN